MTKQTLLKKVKVNNPFWYIEGHIKVIKGIHLGLGLAMIDGKLENMNPNMMVYTSDPSKKSKTSCHTYSRD